MKYTCSSCKQDFSFEQVKYGIDGKSIFCKECFSKLPKTEIKMPKGHSALPSQTIKFICTNCRYKFSIKKDSRINRVCPYCGKAKLINDETTADKLLEEAAKS